MLDFQNNIFIQSHYDFIPTVLQLYFNYYGLSSLFYFNFTTKYYKIPRCRQQSRINSSGIAHSAYVTIKLEDSRLAFARATFHGTANFAIGSRFWSNHRDKRGTNKFLSFCNRARDNFFSVLSSRVSVQLQRQLSILFGIESL